MTLHDLFTLLNLLIGSSGYDMTQLHQHGLHQACLESIQTLHETKA